MTLLANAILVVHTFFVVFVVFGFACIVLGLLFHWRLAASFWFRTIHLLAIAFVAGETWLGIACPLTDWESRLREAAGGEAYRDGLLAYWLSRLLYYDFEPWVFTFAYTVFLALVVLTWLLRPPQFPWKSNKQSQ